jgi:hypothetical protein
VTAIPATETVVAESTVKPETVTDLPGQVDAHMREHFPYDEPAGGWETARDYRDNTAVVVWRRHGTDLPGGSRGILLYHWHLSLQSAGFICVGRTDMEVFGRPDEQSPDGRAMWIHVTGWEPNEVRPPRTVGQIAYELRRKLGVAEEHVVPVDPATSPRLPHFMDGAMDRVHGLRFSEQNGRLKVTVVFRDAAEPLPNPPAWVLALAEEHKGHGEGWCGEKGGVE